MKVTKEFIAHLDGDDFLVEVGDECVLLEGIITEASVRRRYLKVINGDEETYYSPASANDNYMLYFIDRLFKSRRFKNGQYSVKVVNKVPSGFKKKSLETFLKELLPLPAKGEKK